MGLKLGIVLTGTTQMLNKIRKLTRRMLSAFSRRSAVIGIALVLLAIAGIIAFKSVSALQNPVEPGSLEEIAQNAKAQGTYEVNQIVTGTRVGVDGLDDAVSNYSIVLAQPIASSTHITDPFTFMTWYKFRVYETLSSRPYLCSECSSTQPFSDLFPLNADEILVPDAGGTIVVDGVTFNRGESTIPGYDLSTTYVLFIDLNSATKIGTVRVGSVGVFVKSGDTLVPREAGTAISGELSSRYGNSLNCLRASLNGSSCSTPTPTPTPCQAAPAVIRRCEQLGGGWDQEACACSYL